MDVGVLYDFFSITLLYALPVADVYFYEGRCA